MPELVVFDTNVLFSAVGWKGRPYQCLELARMGVVEGCTCREILEELAGKLSNKLRFSAEEVAETVTDFLGFLRVVPIAGTLRVVAADPDDDKVIECAVEAGAEWVVTGDRQHLLLLVSFQGIQIVSPAEFLSQVSSP